jgi:IS605 OrfB family transposase
MTQKKDEFDRLGTIRIVLKRAQTEVHYTSQIKCSSSSKSDAVIGVDFGYSEVLTDSDGEQYGTEFGNIMRVSSDWLKTKMQNRHKLHALQKKYACSPQVKQKRKARYIKKYNLGNKTLVARQQRLKATLSRDINTAYNKLARKQSNTIVSESLSQAFDYNKGKNWNRRLSAWVKGMLKERLEFKALAKGFSHQQVNPAYSSQTCSHCGYVDSKNRRGDKFQCRHCGHVGHADWIAAMNLKSRYCDREITRYTPYRDVTQILLGRFNRHLETKSSGTVSGRIPDTA